MAELYIFSQDDELLTILSEDTGLTSAPFRDELNSVADEPFVFTVDADVEKVKYVKEENRVVFRDRVGDYREFVIKELDDRNGNDGPETTAICLPAFVDELSEHYVLDRRFNDATAQTALDASLEGTRYVGEVEGAFGRASTNFYRLSSLNCIWRIRNVWGGDIKDVVELDEKGRISQRKIILKQRLGADRGLRFEIDHNIEEIQRTILSYPKTALYGWGASLETDDGGHTRFIDFADVEWSKANGDPVDKPKGQRWVGDPDALQKLGRLKDGQRLHRFGEYYNHEIEDPRELLEHTWNHLQEVAKNIEINYRLRVDLLDKPAELGDTAVALDREFARPIEIQTRIIAIEYDLLDIEGTTVVEMGQFLNLDDDIYRDIEQLREQVNRPRPIPPITDDSFPDTVPPVPTNFKADGLYKIIKLSWDYDPSSYIAAYEVYASQVKGFIPDEQHMVWRGKSGGYNHEADINQKWYFRVRAINTHGTASDFSDEIEGATVRINAQTDIQPLTITNELIAENARIDFAKIANVQITNAMLDRATVNRIQIQDADIVSVRAETIVGGDFRGETFKGGYFEGATVTGSFIVSEDAYGNRLQLSQGVLRGTGDGQLSISPIEVSLTVHNRGIRLEGGRLRLLRDTFSVSVEMPTNRNVFQFNNLAVFQDGIEIFGVGINNNITTRDITIRGGNSLFTNSIDHNGTGTHMYIRPDNGGELRVTRRGTTGTYEDARAKTFISEGTIGLNFTDMYTQVRFPNNGQVRFYNASGQEILAIRDDIGSANDRSIRLQGLEHYTTSASANMYISSSYNVVRSTSARKYKKDIEPIEESYAFNFFEKAQPVWFRSKAIADPEHYGYYGYIADDVAEFEPRLVTFREFDSEGNRLDTPEPEGFNYDRVPALLHVVMKKKFEDYDNDILALRQENRQLKERVEVLENRIA